MSDKNQLNDAELTKMSEPVVIETTKDGDPVQTEPADMMKTIVSGYGAMTDEEAAVEASYIEKVQHEIAQKYMRRRIDASMKEIGKAKVKTVEKRGVDYSEPVEPALSDKERKNKRKELAKKKKKALKQNDKATEYSLDILAAQEARNVQIEKEQLNKMLFVPTVKKALSGPENLDRYTKIMRVWDPLSVFAPKVKLKKGLLTPESEKEQQKYISGIVNDTDKMIADIKTKMLEEQVNPNKYTQKYVGEHFGEMRDQVDRLKAYTSLFAEGTPEYETLNIEEKAYVKQLIITADLAEKVLVECANMNGVHIEDEEKKSDLHGVPNLDNYFEAQRQLKKHLDSREDAIKQEADGILDAEYDKLHDNAVKLQRDLCGMIIKDQGDTEKYSYIDLPLTKAYHFDAIDETIRKIDRFAKKFPEKYEENKEKITGLMGEFLKSVQLQSEYSINSYIFDLIMTGGTIKETPEGIKEIDGPRGFTDLYAQKRYAKESDELKKCIEMSNCLSQAMQYLAGGPVPSEFACRILKEKGIVVPEFEETVKESQKSAKVFVTRPAEKEDLFKTLFLEKVLKEEEKEKVVKGETIGEKKTKLQEEKDRERILGNPLLHKEPLSLMFFGLKLEQPYINEMMVDFAWDYINLNELKTKQKEGKATDEDSSRLAVLRHAVSEEMKDILSYLIKEVKSFDMPWLKEGNPDVMRAHAEELLEMSHMTELIKALGKQKDPENEDAKETLIDVLLGENTFDEAKVPAGEGSAAEKKKQRETILRESARRVVFDRKLEMIKGGAMKARAATLLHAYTLGKVDMSFIQTKADRGTVSEGDIVKYAKDLYTTGSAIVEREEKKFFSDPVVQEESLLGYSTRELFTSEVHRPLTLELDDVSLYLSEETEKRKKDKEKYPKGISKDTYTKEYYTRLYSELNDIEAELREEHTEEEKRKLLEERDETILEMENVQMVYGLSLKRFTLAAGPAAGHMAEIFRSLPAMEACGTFDSLTDAEYRDLLLDLSAGAFLNEHSDKRDIEIAQMRNLLGIKTYLTLAANRYERIINKFGNGKPDFVYIFEHRDELAHYSALAQEDGELIINFPQVFDERNDEDQRVMNLVKYGTSLVWSMSGMIAGAIPLFNSGMSVKDITEDSWRPITLEQKTLNTIREKDNFRRKFIGDDRDALRPQAKALFEEAAQKAREIASKKTERGNEQ